MWLIVGLGNPGRKYERHRHNIGFRVVDELARRHGYAAFRARLGGDTSAGAVQAGGRPHKALLLKPMEFMNLSGHAVQRLAQFHEIEPRSIVVIHDDLDIDLGRIKLKAGGGHGGHNGLRSITQQLGSGDFLRVRVGIGKPGPAAGDAAPARSSGRDQRVVGHVLGDFPAAQEGLVIEVVGQAADAVEAILAEGMVAAMNKFHATKPDPDPESRV